jgi:hypothetical protein
MFIYNKVVSINRKKKSSKHHKYKTENVSFCFPTNLDEVSDTPCKEAGYHEAYRYQGRMPMALANPKCLERGVSGASEDCFFVSGFFLRFVCIRQEVHLASSMALRGCLRALRSLLNAAYTALKEP